MTPPVRPLASALPASYNLPMLIKIVGTNGPVTLWSSIETNVAIICASLPALHPLLTRLFPRLASSVMNRSRSRSKSGSQSEPGPPLGTPSGSSGDRDSHRLDGRTIGVSDTETGGQGPDSDSGTGGEEINAGRECAMAGADGVDEAIAQAEEEEDWGERLRKKRWRREIEAQT